jgi:hypothetical protein
LDQLQTVPVRRSLDQKEETVIDGRLAGSDPIDLFDQRPQVGTSYRYRRERAFDAVLGLRAEIERQRFDVGFGAEDDRDVGWPRGRVDANLTKDILLGLLNPGVSGTDDDVYRLYRLRTEGQGVYRLSPSD